MRNTYIQLSCCVVENSAVLKRQLLTCQARTGALVCSSLMRCPATADRRLTHTRAGRPSYIRYCAAAGGVTK